MDNYEIALKFRKINDKYNFLIKLSTRHLHFQQHNGYQHHKFSINPYFFIKLCQCIAIVGTFLGVTSNEWQSLRNILDINMNLMIIYEVDVHCVVENEGVLQIILFKNCIYHEFD